jgi:hypothetical protein
MTHYFSPYTGELINTDAPSDWMGRTEQAPPEFDPKTQGAFFVDGAWQVITAAAPQAPVPTSITMRQARLALLQAGLLTTVNAGVSSMGQAAQIEWEFAATVDRTSTLVGTLAAALGLNSAAIDALFLVSAGL